MRTLKFLIGVAAGIALFIGGIATLDDTDVNCGGKPMSPTDTCVSTKGSKSTEYDYAAMKKKAEDPTGSYVMMGVGGLLAVGCAIQVFLGTRRREPTAQPPFTGYPQPGQPGYPPPPAGYQPPPGPPSAG
ncbi:MAG: hypothetical protein QM728_08490 [Gordonia sp. (in: high G+C Gram-positive bacteria)]|uniref:hypothetical protein n=1 Tax=Gordonia sp. (in: high G+C Gram-positive bacteria) TaxID=84139 RepID=UPI0039E4582E